MEGRRGISTPPPPAVKLDANEKNEDVEEAEPDANGFPAPA
eukprot:tig00001628_g9425.t1